MDDGRAGDLHGLGADVWAGFGAAVEEVAAWGRGRPVPEVEAALLEVFRSSGVFISAEDLHLQARWFSDPQWAQDDPQAVERVLAQMRSPAREAAKRALEKDWGETMRRLEKAVDSMRRLRDSTITSRRTVDGMEFEVRIDPWSPRRVRKLQRAAAPAVVTVLPMTTPPSGSTS